MKLLTTREVAELLGVSPLTVVRLADANALPVVVVASRARRRILRFRAESVDQFISTRERPQSVRRNRA